MHLRRSLHLSGVIGFLAFPKMGRARRHVAAVSLAGDVHLRGESGAHRGRKLPGKKIRFSIILGIIFTRFFLSNNFSNLSVKFSVVNNVMLVPDVKWYTF